MTSQSVRKRGLKKTRAGILGRKCCDWKTLERKDRWWGGGGPAGELRRCVTGRGKKNTQQAGEVSKKGGGDTQMPQPGGGKHLDYQGPKVIYERVSGKKLTTRASDVVKKGSRQPGVYEGGASKRKTMARAVVAKKRANQKA